MLSILVRVCYLFRFRCQYLPSDWLETPLRMPIHGKKIISKKPMWKSACISSFCLYMLLCVALAVHKVHELLIKCTNCLEYFTGL